MAGPLSNPAHAPLIVTAELGGEDLAWLDGLRRRHYPPERNQLPAHLTMFHALAPSAERELRDRLAACAAAAPPAARIAGIMDLGGGVAFRVVSDALDAIRDELADGLHGLLTAQDSGGWRPHVTIQNKVAPKVARALAGSVEQELRPGPLRISGLGLHRYLGGPWETLAIYKFRGR
ncbi:MAG: 2'-5' RNA ligase family protein [Sphingomicrobium sp.]